MPATAMTDRTRSIWKSRLSSAFRTGLACTIVGGITLFGPVEVQHILAFPALSYVTVIMIVSEATLGDALRGCFNAMYGTLQGVIPAIVCLWLLGPARFSVYTIAIAVTVSTFVIVLPKSTHVIAKRIALAQLVVVYSVTFDEGVRNGALHHPVHVLLSTAVGAFASVLALLLPFPRLACSEVREKCKLLKKNTSERVDLYVKALCAENNTAAHASLSQAKSLSQTGSSLLQTMKLKQESMQWERPQCGSSRPYYMDIVDKVQALEKTLRGMEMALTSSPSFPIKVADQELSNLLLSLKEGVSVALKHSKCSIYSDSSTISKTKNQILDKSLQAIQPALPTHNDLPSFFFLFCINSILGQLITDQPPKPMPNPEESVSSRKQEKRTSKYLRDWSMKISKGRLLIALKCSLSLGLAVFFGMIFSKDNGYWSGLTVAVGMAFGREATFTVANLKAQGTVLGSIYGVLICFLFQRFLAIRFVAVLPWIIFTSFLRSSRMYGPAGAMSAVMGALIILGRKNYGPPNEFAIVRIIEVFIGLTCSIVIELLLQPTRASSLSKVHLSRSLGTLGECIQSISLHASSGNKQSLSTVGLKEKVNKLQVNVGALSKLIREAEVEPNFWFMPFQSTCYGKLLGSLSKMLELLSFATHAMDLLVRESQSIGASWKDHQESMDADMDLFRKLVGPIIKCLNKVTSVKSLAALEKEMRRRDITCDLELGISSYSNGHDDSDIDDDDIEKITDSFLQHLLEVIEKIQTFEVEDDVRSQMFLSLSAVGFCMYGLMKETRELKKNVKDLIQCENPSTPVNLHEIHCKIKALNT